MGKSFSLERLGQIYMDAKQYVIHCGFSHEIDWQEELRFEDLDEARFLKEIAWVILSSGMRETVIRKKFGAVSKAFLNWTSSSIIYAKRDICYTEALIYFNNKPKIQAIIDIASYVHKHGFENVRKKIEQYGIEFLIKFPFIGPATSLHLAKNLGLEVAKPDRHLTRIACNIGYPSVENLCTEIAKITGEKISVVDIVLWRFATLDNKYLDYFVSNT